MKYAITILLLCLLASCGSSKIDKLKAELNKLEQRAKEFHKIAAAQIDTIGNPLYENDEGFKLRRRSIDDSINIYTLRIKSLEKKIMLEK